MRIVIQCAASKNALGGYFRTDEEQPVKFVAHPDRAVPQRTYLLARPDDLIGSHGYTWRQRVSEYNERTVGNPHGLLPAYRLYAHAAYRDLVQAFGENRVFVLSAGWGLINSSFLTPQYDITFGGSAEPWKRRRTKDVYHDFVHLTADSEERVVFLGGRSYLPLFCRLTSKLNAERVVFFNSQTKPHAPGCRLVRYETRARTNWHYGCTRDLLAGRLERAVGE